MQKLYRWYAKYQLIKRYKYLLEVDRLMEEFTTQNILDGGSPEFIAASRNQLVTLQNEMRGRQRLLDFLRNTK